MKDLTKIRDMIEQNAYLKEDSDSKQHQQFQSDQDSTHKQRTHESTYYHELIFKHES